MAKTRSMNPIGPTETIRHRLDMSMEKFGEAIGFGSGSYAGMVKSGKITVTAALAAECLMRRQAPTGESADQLYILRSIKGTMVCLTIENTRSITLDGEAYFLVPKGSIR